MIATDQSSLFARLERRFPGVDFDVEPSEGGSLSVYWEEAYPSNDQIASFFQSAGYLTAGSNSIPGYIQVQLPRQTSQRTRSQKGKNSPRRQTRQRSIGRRKDKSLLSFGAQGLWSISDLEVIRTIAERWVNSLRNPGTITYYVGGMSLLLIATGYLTWTLDIRPSLIFGQHLAAQLANEWITPNLLTAIVFLLSITPNLLEFFATGLAAYGNVIVDISIKAALLFDAATDAPMAFSISRAMVAFFLPDPSLWSGLLSVLVAMPVLLFSTIVVEILFLSFLTTFALLIRRSFELHRPRRSYGR